MTKTIMLSQFTLYTKVEDSQHFGPDFISLNSSFVKEKIHLRKKILLKLSVKTKFFH